VRAAAAVPGTHLVIAGDGEQRQPIDALGRELLGDRYRRLVLGRAVEVGHVGAADVLLHMSQDEPFGNIYIEALASGLPIVAHDRPVTRWIVEEHAELVDTNQSSLVTNALRRAIDTDGANRSAGRRDAAVRRFSWESVAKAYCDFFRDVYGSNCPA
jgi:glycosyltransferase involved in cell wall biosynthesis